MLRKVLVCAFALAGLSACVTPENNVYPRAPMATPPPVYSQPQGPNLYASAAFASLHSEMFACNTYGSNLGEIGGRREIVRYTPYIQTEAGALLRNPTEGACLSSGFGWRNTATGGGREHSGLDLANPNGGYIYAAAEGWVVFAGWRGGYGNVLEIDHGSRVRTLYAHLAEIDPRLSPGVHVPAGAPVARMGMTGNATGVHLHYEVSVDGVRVDPINFGAPPVIEMLPDEPMPQGPEVIAVGDKPDEPIQ
jgi:murein DD-endopeptidase MepM/ murein hydrolase activator NlpD